MPCQFFGFHFFQVFCPLAESMLEFATSLCIKLCAWNTTFILDMAAGRNNFLFKCALTADLINPNSHPLLSCY